MPDNSNIEETAIHKEIELGSAQIRSRFMSIRDGLLRKGKISHSAADELGRAINEVSFGIGIKVPINFLDAKLIRFKDMNELSWLTTLSSILLALSSCCLGTLITLIISSAGTHFIYLLIVFCSTLVGITTIVTYRKYKILKEINSAEKIVSIIKDNISVMRSEM